MFSTMQTLAVALAAVSVAAQDPFSTYNSTKRLPATCVDGYTAGSDSYLLTVPYTYSQVLTIIGDFKNLTWSGVTSDQVTLNGTSNTVGTARSYSGGGFTVVETLQLYMKPSSGPFAEVYSVAPIKCSSYSSYSSYNALFAQPTCNGTATLINQTVSFCATDADAAKSDYRSSHVSNVAGLSQLLGGANFTTCAVLSNSTMSSSNSTSNVTTTTSSIASSMPTTTLASSTTPPPPPATTTPAASPSPTNGASSLVGSVAFAAVMALGAVLL